MSGANGGRAISAYSLMSRFRDESRVAVRPRQEESTKSLGPHWLQTSGGVPAAIRLASLTSKVVGPGTETRLILTPGCAFWNWGMATFCSQVFSCGPLRTSHVNRAFAASPKAEASTPAAIAARAALDACRNRRREMWLL